MGPGPWEPQDAAIRKTSEQSQLKDMHIACPRVADLYALAGALVRRQGL